MKSRKFWVAAVIVLLSLASVESEDSFASKTYLTDEIGEGSVFKLDHHLHPLLAKGAEIYLQDGHSVALTEINPDKAYCLLKLNGNHRAPASAPSYSTNYSANYSKESNKNELIVHFANAASTHWFFQEHSELECHHVDTTEEFTTTVQGFLSVEKHRVLRTFVGGGTAPSELSKS